MIGLDTNILVRFLMEDDPAQTAKVHHLIERKLTEQNPGFVSLAAILETVWVLESVYQRTRLQVAGAIRQILQVETFLVQNEQEVYSAMVILESGKGSFEDALIAALGAWAGCETTLTFDHKATCIPGLRLLS